MKQLPKILTVTEKHLLGLHTELTMNNNLTIELWQKFMPRKKEILQLVSDSIFPAQVYPSDYFDSMQPNKPFTMWATVEINPDTLCIPEGMEILIIPEGLYACFTLVGMDIQALMRYIFIEWLPISGYKVANRPHFAIMDKRYKHNQPDSQEDIYIPII